MGHQDTDRLGSVEPVAPAEGERRAIAGYYPQYRIAASLVLRGLRDETLEWIRVADPQAGRVDDLQVGSTSRVDAFQVVKWTQYGGNFTFNDLIAKSGTTPSLVAQLADGWRRLRESRPSHRIVVHFITNQVPSVADHGLPVGDPPPTPRHFSAFLKQVWKPSREGSPVSAWNIPTPWEPTWDALQREAGLSDSDFKAFIQDCELEFGYRLPGSEVPTERDQEIVQTDLERITQVLFATVADPARIIELTRDQLLSRLGWKTRFAFRSRHMFPVDEALYHPVEATVRQLEQALLDLSGGYVAVLGTPGSGKSTLLSQTLRFRMDRVIQYYAYIPDGQDPTTLRGEATNFLHDVVLAIERAGFRVGESLSNLDRDQLLGRFHEQLNLLHEDWRSTGRKTLILIDGLDHIEREQHPNRSLLLDLPLPEQVSDGVYFFLGSQTDTPFPDRVQAAVRQPDRRIEMQPLSRDAVLRIVERAGFFASPSLEQKEQIYVLSGGHPLALIYLLNRLREAPNTEAIQDILNTSERYEGSIEEEYHSYWRQIEQDNVLAHLLGLLARIRGVIDLSWVESWAERAVVDRLRHSVAHYFRREDHNRWYFFHNSFRLFLTEKTAESSPGVFDPSRDRKFHYEMAVICEKAQPGSHWAWEELHHRVLAEDHEAVLRRATPDWFRSQFLAFRPIDAIQADIRLALRSAAALHDPVALTRLVLAAAEMGNRTFHLDNQHLISLLLDLGEMHIAIDHIRDGNRLRIHVEPSLRASVSLKSAGLIEEARRVFELAEPLELLGAPIDDDPQDKKGEALEAWAEAAIHFRDVREIMKAARRVRRGPDHLRQIDPEKVTRSLQNRLLFHAGIALLNERRWEDLATIGSAFDTGTKEDLTWWLWLQIHAWKDRLAEGDKDKGKDFLEKAFARINTGGIGHEERVALAEGIYRILGNEEEAYALLQGIPQPNLITDLYSYRTGLHPFLQRFRLNRLLCALGHKRSPVEIVPDPSDPRHQGIVYFERAICIVAQIWGDSWRGLQYGTAAAHEVFPLLRLFYRRWPETRDWASWGAVEGTRGEFYTLVVDAVAQHGLDAVEALRTAFEREWENSEVGFYWSSDVRRQLILALGRVGASREWVVERFRLLEEHMLDDVDVSGRVEECRKQAEGWIILGESERARRLLQKMLRVSFGVGYRKDYQLDSWIRWLGRVNQVEPENAAERIAWFARAIVAMERSTEGDATKYASDELLAATARWSPRRAILLFRWFFEQGIVRHEEALRVLIREFLEAAESPMAVFPMMEVLLLIGTGPEPELVRSLIEKTASREGIGMGSEVARRLLADIHVLALPSTRAGWCRGVAQALEALGVNVNGFAFDFTPLEQEEISSRSLNLKDGSALSSHEVVKRSSTVADLIVLLESESESSYFDWEPTVSRIAGALDRPGVLSLAEHFRIRRRSAQILSVLSERLSALGDTDGAWQLGQQALDASYSWSRWIDGATRLAASRALVRADPIVARPLIFKTVAQDGGGGAENLEEIVPLLVSDMPLREVWGTIEAYVHALFEGSSFPDSGPELFGETPPQDSPERAAVDLLILHLEHPTNALAQVAKRALVAALIRGEPLIGEAVRELLQDTEDRQEHVLMVLDAVSHREVNAVVQFRDQIASLCLSPNYSIRRTAEELGVRTGCVQASIGPGPIPLPPIYTLSLPPPRGGTIVNRQEISESEPLPDTDDPLEIVRPHDFTLGLVADAAGLRKQNLCHRAVQIMRRLAPEESWSAKGEIRLRGLLGSAGLRVAFRRPRAVLARRATFHVIAELVDAGGLSIKNLYRLESFLRYYDPLMFLVDPGPRPPDVQPMLGRDHRGVRNHEWIDQVGFAVESNRFEAARGGFILAEETILKRLEWETPTETRRCGTFVSSVVHPDTAEADRFFQGVTNTLIKEYPVLQAESDPVQLILRHTDYGFDSPGERWLALNPVVGNSLGWNLAGEGLFRWVDSQGEVMVESIWWVHGFVGQAPPHFDDEVGEGWLVVASQAALSAMILQFGDLKRVIAIKRGFRQNGQKLEREVRAELAV